LTKIIMPFILLSSFCYNAIQIVLVVKRKLYYQQHQNAVLT
jgi:hypothetical protein